MSKTVSLAAVLLLAFVLLLSLLALPALAREQGLGAARADLRAGRIEPVSGQDAPPRAPARSPAPKPLLQGATFAFTATPGLAIPDVGCSGYFTSAIAVSQSFSIEDLNVGLNISHTYRNDLNIYLRAPDNSLVELLTLAGSYYSNFDVMLDEDSPAAPGVGSHDPLPPYYDVTWNPEGNLDAVVGKNAQGTWTLEVCDGVSGFSGTLNFWSLWFTKLPASPDFDASTKSAPANTTPGATLPYTVTLFNQSTATAANVTMVDPIPAGTSYVSGSATAVSGTVVYTAALNRIEWSGNISPLKRVDVSFQVVVTAAGGTITNTATISQAALTTTVTISAASEVAVPAPFPMCTGFEGGTLPPSMFAETTTSSGSTGRARVTADNPLRGTYALDLDTDTCCGVTRQAAVLVADLAGVPQAELSFWMTKHGYANNVPEGVYISDNRGAAYTKIYTPSAFSFAYQGVLLNLAAAAQSAGLTLTDTFFIKFQASDSDSIPYAGHSYDDICLKTAAVDLSYSEKSAPALAADGTGLTYSVAVQNFGSLTATNVTLVDP
ncbi:MAG: proprotein convertase P-domain-containing protein, partial [Anaerolineae bacterium]